jgi:adenine-specific DNA-methyltransferase
VTLAFPSGRIRRQSEPDLHRSPFDTGADFSFTATVPDHPEAPGDNSCSFTKEASIIEQKASRETWGHCLESYLQWMSETLTILHELLAEDGTIYVHLDVHRGPYIKLLNIKLLNIKLLMDEIFGVDNFRNEIAWYYYNKMHDSRKNYCQKLSIRSSTTSKIETLTLRTERFMRSATSPCVN